MVKLCKMYANVRNKLCENFQMPWNDNGKSELYSSTYYKQIKSEAFELPFISEYFSFLSFLQI
jgi:hypothetical protein